MKRKNRTTKKKPAIETHGYAIDVSQERKRADESFPDSMEPVALSEKKDDTRPVSVVSVRHLKNIYGSPVNVGAHLTPSGREYKFAPNQTLPIEPEDYHYLLSLSRNPGPGCCEGTPAEQAQRHYFGVP